MSALLAFLAADPRSGLALLSWGAVFVGGVESVAARAQARCVGHLDCAASAARGPGRWLSVGTAGQPCGSGGSRRQGAQKPTGQRFVRVGAGSLRGSVARAVCCLPGVRPWARNRRRGLRAVRFLQRTGRFVSGRAIGSRREVWTAARLCSRAGRPSKLCCRGGCRLQAVGRCPMGTPAQAWQLPSAC